MDARLHINVKEIMALLIFLRDFFPSISRRIEVVVWEMDNTSAFAYVKKEGGTSSLPLQLLPSVFQRMCNRWGTPQIDLFASQ